MRFIDKSRFHALDRRQMIDKEMAMKVFSRVLGSNKTKSVYQQWQTQDVQFFLDEYKRHTQIKHFVSPDHIAYIPLEGGLLVLANHPTGIPDGLLILDTLLSVRKDVKMIINESSYTAQALEDYTIGIVNHKNENATAHNAIGVKKALEWLSEGHCLVLFSNSEVSTERKLYKHFDDHFWHPTAKKIILKFQGNVLPWAISGKNSPLFYQLCKISPNLKGALLERESLKRKRRPIHSVIGKPFKVTDEHSLYDLELKIRLMSHSNHFSLFKAMWPLKPKSKMDTIAESAPIDAVKTEILNLGAPLLEKGSNQVFLSTAKESPSILHEIGRLREITFRKAREGSGKSLDLDRYDNEFLHLFLWDKDANIIIGAYRLGIGHLLHTNSNYHSILYDFYEKNDFIEDILKDSMIMGRAFVVPEYQQKAFPLFLLWMGILSVLRSQAPIKYIIGQTSLPNSFSDYSKLLLTGFLWKHYNDQEKSEHFNAFHPFTVKPNILISNWINKSVPEDVKRMDKIIECIEPNGAKTPMLFKRYIEQKAVCLGMNIDPDFQNSVDILMLTKVEDLLFSPTA